VQGGAVGVAVRTVGGTGMTDIEHPAGGTVQQADQPAAVGVAAAEQLHGSADLRQHRTVRAQVVEMARQGALR
jgi:hypothetical protein